MKVVASTEAYTIYLRKDGRHAVKGADKAPINGEDKVKILLEQGLITAAPPKAPEPEPVEEEASADGAEEAAETEAASEADEAADADTAGEEDKND